MTLQNSAVLAPPLPKPPSSSLPHRQQPVRPNPRPRRPNSCKIPKTIAFGFLDRRDNVNRRYFLLRTATGCFDADEAVRVESVEELRRMVDEELARLRHPSASPSSSRDHLLDPTRLETLNYCFDRILSHFHTYAPLLADIKNEYTQTITALTNIDSEKRYLRSKIQKLLCEVGTERVLDEERTRILEIGFRVEMIRKENLELKQLFFDEEEQYILSLGTAYQKELNEATGNIATLRSPTLPSTVLNILPPTDPNQKMSLQYKGRWKYIEEWLQRGAAKEPVLQDMLNACRANPQRFKDLFADEDIAVHELADNPEMKKLKSDIDSQKKLHTTRLKDISSRNERIKECQAEIDAVNQKIEEIGILIDAARVRLRKKREGEVSSGEEGVV
ncbi:hypothetical protein HK104_003649 [Borealophlyctis nickersoniae]|nr:hypothetical protein HK104_003649 [Borealophlyctis nickersoniae]